MPTLEENQRAWLDKALQSKGRFTRAASVRSDWEDYRRRRDKAAAGGAGLLDDDPRKALVLNGLEAADRLAEAGKFAEAYKSLSAIKKQGAAASKERAKAVSLYDINVRLNILENDIRDVINMVEFAHNHYKPLLDRLANMEPCSAKPNFVEAARHHQYLVGQQQIMMGEMAGREDWVHEAYDRIRKGRILDRIKELERDIAVHRGAGNAQAVQEHGNRLERLTTQITQQNRRYTNPEGYFPLLKAMRAQVETAFQQLKDLSKYRNDKTGTRPDDKTSQVRDRLEGTANLEWLEVEEEDRLDRARQVMKLAGLKDRPLATDTREGLISRATDLKKFDTAAVFDGLLDEVLGQDGELPDDVTFDKAAAIQEKAVARFKLALARLDPAGDEMFDLMTSSPERLASLAGLELLGKESPEGFSQSHAAMLRQIGEALRKEILATSPNRMKDDGSEITVNGKTYTLVGVVGQGANGKVSRYTDGTGTFVVKSINGGMGGDKFETMRQEMLTHRQLLAGDGVGTDTDHLVAMEGAAIGSDGSVHMMMEDIEGGDMSTVGNNMVLLRDLGILPEEGRKALALDLVAQTVKGMKAMQERGLVHNDMKPQNMMITRDGKVKIIDYGESRFIDDQTGEAPKPGEGGYSTTAGYEAPEHYSGAFRKTGVDSKADTYALGGIAKILSDPSMRESAPGRKMQPVGALGKLTALLGEEDPSKRPSLDAVLMSSLLDQMEEEHNPDDVKELQGAMSEMNLVIKGMKSTLTKEEMKENFPDGKGLVDTLWLPYMNKVRADGGEVPVTVVQTMPNKLEDAINAKRDELAKARPDQIPALRKSIVELERKKAFWTKKVRESADAHREQGRKEIDDLIADDQKTVQVAGDGGGTMTVKAAVALRGKNIEAIAQLQRDFATLARDRPDMAQAWLDETNRVLLAMDAQNKAINAAISALLGPAGRYLLLEQKISEISARFGPRRVVGEEISGRKPPPPPKGGGQGVQGPGDGKIPDPPEMPDRRMNAK